MAVLTKNEIILVGGMIILSADSSALDEVVLSVSKFEQNKNYENAIKLRRFDEGAKKQNIKIKKIEDYKELLISKVI